MSGPRLQQVPVAPVDPERLAEEIPAEAFASFRATIERLRGRLEGRCVWQINSTPRGGGVAEMLRSHLAYVRGAGVDTRWLVIGGDEDFFRLTKRLHHALHGSRGDGGPLGAAERRLYEATLHAQWPELEGRLGPRDLVVLHDPQTAGLAPLLAGNGVAVIWRCHVGSEQASPEIDAAWAFLEPYLGAARACIFTRRSYVPACCDPERTVVIAPSIDPLSAKNQSLAPEVVLAILVHTGLVEGPPPAQPPVFQRHDGSVSRVDRFVDIRRAGRAPSRSERIVTQVSRWDPLKDPIGVMAGFERWIETGAPRDVQLVLAGPNVRAVADDPEAVDTYEQVEAAWRALPFSTRSRVSLASLPMADIEENAAIVNALQRHASVVVQKSLQEGFGLTVSEALWKERPVVASGIGGIRDQIDHGVHGLLLEDPRDLQGLAGALQRLLVGDPTLAAKLGAAGHARVAERFVVTAALEAYGSLVEGLIG